MRNHVLAVNPKHKQTRKLATDWTEFFVTAARGDHKFQFSFCRFAHGALTGSDIANAIDECLMALHFYGFTAVADICDKAAEQQAQERAYATMSVADVKRLIHGPDAMVDDGDESRMVAMPHPCTGEPVFLITDFPHLLKTLRNSLCRYRKGKDCREPLYMMKKDAAGNRREMGIRCLYDAWNDRQKGGERAGVSADNLTRDHFFLTPNMKMRVGVAAAVLSGKMGRYLREHSYLSGNLPLIEFVEKTNWMLDFMNGKHGLTSAIDDKHAKVEEYVSWFDEWEAEHREARGVDHEFIPRATYQGVRTLLGIVWATRYYGRHSLKMIFAQSRANQDVNEHHYGNVRSSAGANRNPNIDECATAGRNATMIRLMRDEKTNSGGAPVDANVSGGLCKRKRERAANSATAEFGDDGFDLTDLLKDLEAQEAAPAMACD